MQDHTDNNACKKKNNNRSGKQIITITFTHTIAEFIVNNTNRTPKTWLDDCYQIQSPPRKTLDCRLCCPWSCSIMLIVHNDTAVVPLQHANVCMYYRYRELKPGLPFAMNKRKYYMAVITVANVCVLLQIPRTKNRIGCCTAIPTMNLVLLLLLPMHICYVSLCPQQERIRCNHMYLFYQSTHCALGYMTRSRMHDTLSDAWHARLRGCKTHSGWPRFETTNGP